MGERVSLRDSVFRWWFGNSLVLPYDRLYHNTTIHKLKLLLRRMWRNTFCSSAQLGFEPLFSDLENVYVITYINSIFLRFSIRFYILGTWIADPLNIIQRVPSIVCFTIFKCILGKSYEKILYIWSIYCFYTRKFSA